MTFIAELERLEELRRSGSLSEEEYATAKEIILRENPSSAEVEGSGRPSKLTNEPRPMVSGNGAVTPSNGIDLTEFLVDLMIFGGLALLIILALVSMAPDRPSTSGTLIDTERVEAIVATKEIPIGTLLTQVELKASTSRQLIAKVALPPGYVDSETDLLNKRLSRTIRAGQPFHKDDAVEDPRLKPRHGAEDQPLPKSNGVRVP